MARNFRGMVEDRDGVGWRNAEEIKTLINLTYEQIYETIGWMYGETRGGDVAGPGGDKRFNNGKTILDHRI